MTFEHAHMVILISHLYGYMKNQLTHNSQSALML